MVELRFSLAAARDLELTALDIATARDTKTALDFAHRLVISVGKHEDHPKIGRSRPHLGLDVRSCSLRPYVVFYRVAPG